MKPLTFSGIDLGLERVGMTCVAQMDLPLTSIELFAGISGFSSPAITPIALVEKEPTCRAVLRRHHPDALILEDVRDVGAHNLPWANVIKFGFPCQDLSVAGKRAGLAGGRSGLFFEATRIIEEMQPEYIIFENVPGLLSGKYEYDEATHTCICGWSSGWRRLHHSVEKPQAISLPDPVHRNERESTSDLSDDSTGIWGEFEAGTQTNNAVVGGLDANNSGRRANLSTGKHSPPSNSENRTMQSCIDTCISDTQSTSNAKRKSVECRVHGSRPNVSQAGTATQSERPDGNVDDRQKINREICPACGRAMGATTTRHVQRTWMGDVLGELARIRYFGAWTVLDAQFFGVAQRRQRLFGVFARHDLGVERCAKILSLATRLRGVFAPSSEARPDVAATIRTSSSGDGVTGTLGTAAGRNRGNVAAALNAHGGARRMDFESENFVVGTLQSHAKAHGHAMTTQQAAENGHLIVASTLNSAGNRGEFRTEPGEHLVAVTFEARYARNGRGAPDTITAPLKAESGQTGKGDGAPLAAGNFGVRRLTPIECERLQGFSETEERIVVDICFDHQNNPVFAEILNLRSQERVGIAERTGLFEPVSSAVIPLNLSNQRTSKPVHKSALISCEENAVEIRSQEKLVLAANFVDKIEPSPRLMQAADFVHLLAGLRLTLEHTTRNGEVASQVSEQLSMVRENGSALLKLSGAAIMQHVSNALSGSITHNQLFKSTTFVHSNTENTEQILITSFCSALSAINGYIPMQTVQNGLFRIEIALYSDYTAWGIDEQGQRVEMADSVRYRMCGNAVCKKVSAWLDTQILQYGYAKD